MANTEMKDFIQNEFKELEATRKELKNTLNAVLLDRSIVRFTIDTSGQIEKVKDQISEGVVKAKIPVFHNAELKTWYLNIKNPTYFEVVKRMRDGQFSFMVLTTGAGKNTRYSILEEEPKEEVKEVKVSKVE